MKTLIKKGINQRLEKWNTADALNVEERGFITG